jgi:hypothetical protein
MKSSALLLSVLLLAGISTPLCAEDQLQTLHESCTLSASHEDGQVDFRLQRGSCEGLHHDCGTNETTVPLSSFSNFNLADLKRDGTHLDATLAAEAGKLTCSGTVHDLKLSGDSSFVPDPAFVARMRQMGFSGLASEKLQAYTLFHIETSWIQSLEAAGVTGMDSNNILALRIFKIDAPFVRSMDSLGYAKLPADKLIAFKVHGVNPEEVKQYRAMGYQPSADELIQMRIFKVTPDFIQRMQARNFNNLTISKLVQIRIFKLAE